MSSKYFAREGEQVSCVWVWGPLIAQRWPYVENNIEALHSHARSLCDLHIHSCFTVQNPMTNYEYKTSHIPHGPSKQLRPPPPSSNLRSPPIHLLQITDAQDPAHLNSLKLLLLLRGWHIPIDLGMPMVMRVPMPLMIMAMIMPMSV